MSSRRRSILRVSSISGSEVKATNQAYTVRINPTCSGCMAKLAPMSLSSATGANSVVLKINAAKASATTLSQLPWWAVFDIVMEVEPDGERGRQAQAACCGRAYSRVLEG